MSADQDSPLQQDVQLRILARSLLADENDADDLVQETYVTALEHGFSTRRASGRWWREMLRLKARSLRRQEERRRRRESAVAIPEAACADDSAERREAFLRALERAVAELEEPYRSTLFLRFLEGLPPREIARRSGENVRTVNTRILRGSTQLRERLDRDYGRAAWSVLVLGLPPRGDSGVGVSSGEDARKDAGRSNSTGATRPRALGRVVAVISASLLVVAAATWIALREDARAPSGALPVEIAVRSPASRDTDVAAQVPPVLGGEAVRRRSVPVEAVSQPPPVMEAATGYTGFVVDPEGRPLAGVPVFHERGGIRSENEALGEFTFSPASPASPTSTRGPGAHTVSGPRGRFELALLGPEEGRILARGAGYRPVTAEVVPLLGSGRGSELRLVVAPARSVTGRVVDPEGQPVEGATVRLRPSAEFAAAFPRAERSWLPVLSPVQTDAEGRFDLHDAYDMERMRFEILRDGFVTARRFAKPKGPLEFEVRLEREPAPASVVHGTVIDVSGAPLTDAVVVAARSLAHTALDGRFELELEEAGERETLWAVAGDRLPARVELVREPDGAFASPLVVTLGEESAAIEGVVLDASGEPATAVYVWCHDMTKIGTGRSTWFAETWIDPGEWKAPMGVLTDEAGRFRMPYLLDRAYRIGTIARKTLDVVLSEPIAAGTTDAVLVLPTDQARSPVEGRVLTSRGEPIVGVRVLLTLQTLNVPLEPGISFVTQVNLRTVETDEQGWFAIADVPGRGFDLVVAGEEVVRNSTPVPAMPAEQVESEGVRRVDLTIARRARLRVVSTGTCPDADRFSLYDAADERLTLHVAQEVDRSFDLSPYVRIEIDGGRSVLVVAPDTAATIVLYRGDEELCRRPVELSVEEMNELAL